MSGVPADVLLSRAALSRLFEPSDAVGLALTVITGPVDALRIATGSLQAGEQLHREVAGCLDLDGGPRDVLTEGLDRWAPRRKDLAPARDLATMGRLGGRLVVPESPDWPNALGDLQLAAPLCLWVRGTGELPALERVVALVGSRDSTSYGNAVTADLAAGLVGRGFTIISGGAYGIDAQAHRAALAVGGEAEDGGSIPTLAVMACGVDRYYPAGNEQMLRAIAEQGFLVSEVPPGSSPTRWRFLQRNRLIAALSAVTVVVEARWRSGALNTAHHAAGLGRPVGAVPGSVHSANSAGCHRLLRDGSAVCVTDSAEIAELAGPIGSEPEVEHVVPALDHDGLAVQDILLLDALPVRTASTVEKLSSVAGLSTRHVIAGLSRLEIEGLATRSDDGWRRRKKDRSTRTTDQGGQEP